MSKKPNLQIVLISLIFIKYSLGYGQVIQGSLKFEDPYLNSNFVTISNQSQKVTCNTNGSFQLNQFNISDTIIITPIPIHFTVKIYNLSLDKDTIQLDSIPMFRKIDEGFPIINFTSKRASRKYFKEYEKKKLQQEIDLQKHIDEYLYFWEGNTYQLKLKTIHEESIIYIDLRSALSDESLKK